MRDRSATGSTGRRSIARCAPSSSGIAPRRPWRAFATGFPGEWEGAWIDYVHDYVALATSDEFRRIYAAYAPSVGAAPAGVSLWRVAV